MIPYGFVREVHRPFDEVLEALPGLLQKEGFGVISQIDIQQKLQEKLGVDFRRYRILGACNPPNAYKALQAEENIGLLLPCNVVVHEKGETTVVAAVRPSVTMRSVDNPALAPLANEIEEKLRRVIESV